jgi:Fe-S-cluster containining protein
MHKNQGEYLYSPEYCYARWRVSNPETSAAMPDSLPGVTKYQFSCTHCGKCCRWPGNVLLTEPDIERLSAALKLDSRAFIERFTRLAENRAQLSLRDGEDGACIFLKQDRCSVYAARPAQCRIFPFPNTTPEECPGLTPV